MKGSASEGVGLRRASALYGNQQDYVEKRKAAWSKVARAPERAYSAGRQYRTLLTKIFSHLILPGQSVLEIGCADGNLLAAVAPSHGVGVDLSEDFIEKARSRHPELELHCADAVTFEPREPFDSIILSDLLNDIWDVQALFHVMRPWCHSGTRIYINTYSRLWQPVLHFARSLRMARPILQQNWLTPEDITNLLALEGYEAFRTFSDLLLPINIPVLSSITNRFLAKLWPFNLFNLTNFMIARPLPEADAIERGRREPEAEPTVSVVVAARNERGNIESVFRRVPELGSETEIVFVEGHSKDGTYEEIERCISEYPAVRSSAYRQTGKGKGDAIRLGFEKASGDILMILDADLTMPPEELPKYYDALVQGKGEFINGVRLVYPMENQAMRFFNLVGNKFFSLAFSWILGQPIKDTLCGTKVLRKRDYEMIAANRGYFGEFDPFGDFDLIFGAARLNLKMVDLPIRYRERTYGDTNISRWSHGWLLLKMVFFATKKIKFR